MSKKDRYEGKAKILTSLEMFQQEHGKRYDLSAYPADAWIQKFKDDLTAFDAVKKDNRAGKGALNQNISKICYEFLHLCGFKTHYLGSLDDTHQVITRLDMIPLECVVRRVATGSLVKRLGVPEGTRMSPPLFEIFLKDDALHDPFMGREHVKLVHPRLDRRLTHRLELIVISIFGHLEALFKACELELIDGKFEFGFSNEQIVLGDEITGDTLRIWHNGQRLDKDVFRHDLGDVLQGYGQILQRLQSLDIKTLAREFAQKGIPSDPTTVVCEVTPQADVLDPEGQAVADVLHGRVEESEFSSIKSVKMGKRIAMTFDRVLSGHGLDHLEKVGSTLLANPLIQEWHFYVDRL